MNKDVFNTHYSGIVNADRSNGVFRSLNSNTYPLLPFMDEKFKAFGCQLLQTSLVQYRQGFITYYEKMYNSIGLSFEFTGCAMAQFSYMDRTFIAHISLHGPGHVYDTRVNWNSFLTQIVTNELGSRYRDFRLFKPFDSTATVLILNHGLTYECCGLIDKESNCYSVIVSKNDSTAFRMWHRTNAIVVDGVLNEENVTSLIIT